MDGLVGALWCGGNLCVLAVGAAGESDRREWMFLLELNDFLRIFSAIITRVL